MNMNSHTDICVIGAGIVGLAHAYHAARKGLSVSVFERSDYAHGASTRNFGMLALVAQSEGFEHVSALRGLSHWQEVSRRADIALQQSGCLFLAREPEELQVLEEFVGNGRNQRGESMLGSKDLSGYNITPDRLLGGMWSDDAWKVDQRSAVAKLAKWLQREYGVAFYFGTNVTAISAISEGIVEVHTDHATGATAVECKHHCKHAIICSGSEFKTLYPEMFSKSGVNLCELQMLRTVPQPANWQLKPFVLGGLSLTRYSAFNSCASLPALHNLQQSKYSDYLEHGIHLIACQETDGSITIGDSHKYGVLNSVKRSEEYRSYKIDELLLKGVRELVRLPELQIAERWRGHYAYLPVRDPDSDPGSQHMTFSPASGVTSVTVTTGQGMTHGFALAEDIIEEITA